MAPKRPATPVAAATHKPASQTTTATSSITGSCFTEPHVMYKESFIHPETAATEKAFGTRSWNGRPGGRLELRSLLTLPKGQPFNYASSGPLSLYFESRNLKWSTTRGSPWDGWNKSANNVLHLRDARGLLRGTLTGHAHEITCAAFSRDENYLISGDLKGDLMLWDLSACTSTRKEGSARSPNGFAFRQRMTRKGYVADSCDLELDSGTDTEEEPAEISAPINATPIHSFPNAHASHVVDVAFDAAGSRFASCGHDGKIHLYRDFKLVTTLAPGSLSPVSAFAFHATDLSLCASGHRDGTTYLWVLEGDGLREEHELPNLDESPVSSAEFHPSKNLLLTSSWRGACASIWRIDGTAAPPTLAATLRGPHLHECLRATWGDQPEQDFVLTVSADIQCVWSIAETDSDPDYLVGTITTAMQSPFQLEYGYQCRAATLRGCAVRCVFDPFRAPDPVATSLMTKEIYKDRQQQSIENALHRVNLKTSSALHVNRTLAPSAFAPFFTFTPEVDALFDKISSGNILPASAGKTTRKAKTPPAHTGMSALPTVNRWFETAVQDDPPKLGCPVSVHHLGQFLGCVILERRDVVALWRSRTHAGDVLRAFFKQRTGREDQRLSSRRLEGGSAGSVVELILETLLGPTY